MDYNTTVYNEIEYDRKMKEWINQRKAAGISQMDVALDMGTSYSMISLIETFKRRSLAAYYYYKNHFGYSEEVNDL